MLASLLSNVPSLASQGKIVELLVALPPDVLPGSNQTALLMSRTAGIWGRSPRAIWQQRSRQDLFLCRILRKIPLPQEVAFSLALGEISEPFESPEGFHMLMRIA